MMPFFTRDLGSHRFLAGGFHRFEIPEHLRQIETSFFQTYGLAHIIGFREESFITMMMMPYAIGKYKKRGLVPEEAFT